MARRRRRSANRPPRRAIRPLSGPVSCAVARSLEHLVEIGARRLYSRPVATVRSPLRPSPTRSPRSRRPSATGSGPASRRRPTPRRAAGRRSRPASHTLIHAPTGSGKTLAAFLWALDRLATHPSAARRPARQPGLVRVLYVSPLKALTYDVERNLRAPLTGIALAAQRLGEPVPHITVASRTGDTPAEDRREIARHPPDILITTPESLYLMLTSAAREILRGVEHVIVDEVHAIAGTKRGAHLALSLERLEALSPTPRAPDAPPMQRIGLSATQRPLETIARFLGGVGRAARSTIVDAGARKPLDLQVVVPVDDMAALGEILPLDEQPGRPGASPRGDLRTSIWPAIHPRILELIRSHRSTIVFTNSRRLAERLAQRLNELAGEELVRAHHGSIAREQRLADRGGAQGRPPPRARRHVQPRARHRHGRRRPRHPGREPDERRPRAPARRPGRPPGRRAEQGRHLPEVPRRPARVRRRHAADARGRHRGDRRSRATRSTSSPSSWWR